MSRPGGGWDEVYKSEGDCYVAGDSAGCQGNASLEGANGCLHLMLMLCVCVCVCVCVCACVRVRVRVCARVCIGLHSSQFGRQDTLKRKALISRKTRVLLSCTFIY